MTSAHREKVNKVLDLMFHEEVSVKDLSFVIAERCLDGDLAEVQRKIKGFLYSDADTVEPDIN